MTRSRKLKALVGVLASLLLFPGIAMAGELAEMCFPRSRSVGVLVGSPAWIPSMGIVRKDLNEPRWTGPLTPFDSNNSGTQGRYRIQRSYSGKYLYVQVQTGADTNSPGNHDRVFFGISRDDGSGNPLADGMAFIVGSTPPASNPETDFSNLRLVSFDYDHARPVGAKWENHSEKPAWIENAARWSKSPVVPENGGDSVDWGVAFVVDLTKLQTEISQDDSYKIVIGLTTNGILDGEATLTKIYTPTPPTEFSDVTGSTFPFVAQFPVDKWQPVAPGSQGCPEGIYLSGWHLRIENALSPSSTNRVALNNGAINTFKATPDFGDVSTEPGGIRAEFRISNWGSGVSMSDAPWNPIRNGGGFAEKVPNAGNLFQFACAPNDGASVCGITPFPSHYQNVFVRLNYGAGYNSTNAPIARGTAYRSAIFSTLSRSQLSAQINTKDIIAANIDKKKRDPGSKETDIVLYVYQRNMPQHGGSNVPLPSHAMRKTRAALLEPPKGPSKSSTSAKESLAKIQSVLRERKAEDAQAERDQKVQGGSKPTDEEVAAFLKIPSQVSPEDAMKEVWPHVEIHPYYQDGVEEKIDGVLYRNLIPMQPFSAYFDHAGALYGFTQKLKANKGKLRVLQAPQDREPGVYVLSVPKNQVAELVIDTEAHEAPATVDCSDCKTPITIDSEPCPPTCSCSMGSASTFGRTALVLGVLGLFGAYFRRRRRAS